MCAFKQEKIGKPPGSLIYTGETPESPVSYSLINYSKETYSETEYTTAESLLKNLSDTAINWVNVYGVHDDSELKVIGKYFKIHSLILEDVMNVHHIPKTDADDNQVFITMKMMDLHETEIFSQEQLSFYLGDNLLICFQERKGDIFDKVRERISVGLGRARNRKADYLLYMLIDITIDYYFDIVERIESEVEDIESKILIKPEQALLNRVLELKKRIIVLGRYVFPVREAILTCKHAGGIIEPINHSYFDDVLDHINHVIENIKNQKELLASLIDLYQSSVGNQMNSVMKLLTVMASIFIPLTFIAGVYGMNFDHMPELHWQYGYHMVWGIMLTMFISMVIYMKRQRWL